MQTTSIRVDSTKILTRTELSAVLADLHHRRWPAPARSRQSSRPAAHRVGERRTDVVLRFGRTPISKGDETRLASPCNVFAKAIGSMKVLSKVKTGVEVTVSKLD